MIAILKYRNIFKLLFAFAVFFGLLYSVINISTPASAAVATLKCGGFVNNNDTLDASCRCKRTQCRLSKLGLPDYNGNDGTGQGTDRVLAAAEDYLCIDGARNESVVLNDGLDAAVAPYKGSAVLEDVKGTKDVWDNIGESVGLKKEIFDNFYTDEFSRLPTNQNIPVNAVCKIIGDGDREQAFWYNPNYFNPQGSNPDGVIPQPCVPLFVSTDIFGNKVTGVRTFFGCLPGSINGAVAFVLRLVVGLSGLTIFIIVLVNLLKIMASATNPDVVADSQKKLFSATATFIFLLLSLTILNILGLEILSIGSLGGGVLDIFTAR